MKRIALAVAALGWLLTPASALQTVYTNNLIPTTAVASTQTFVLDLKSYGIDYLSEQAVYSSATIAAVTFTDGAKSTATVTVSTTGLAGAQGSDSVTVANNSSLAPTAGTDIVFVASNSAVAGSTLTIATGYTLVEPIDYAIGTVSSNTAIALAAAFNNKFPNATATVNGSSVTLTCNNTGAFCNAYTVSSSTQAALTVKSATFSGGADNAIITVNGVPLVQGLTWNVGIVSSNTAVNITNAINGMRFGFTASTTAATVVTIKCSTKGQFCNNYTLAVTVSNSALTVGSANFTGGQDNAILNINGVALTQGTDWTAVATASGTAKAISDAIVANTPLATIITSTWTSGGVVYATSTAIGVNDWNIYASTPALTVPAKFTGGKASNIDTTNNLIAAVSNGMPTGLPVLLTKTTASTIPTGLVVNTTYYVIASTYSNAAVPDVDHFQLATTSTGAFAAAPVKVTAQTGGGSFTVTPLTLNGNLGIVWAASNDATNWNNLSVSSVTFSSTTAKTSTYWDFGQLNARYLQATVNAPSQGAYNVSIIGVGKQLTAH